MKLEVKGVQLMPFGKSAWPARMTLASEGQVELINEKLIEVPWVTLRDVLGDLGHIGLADVIRGDPAKLDRGMASDVIGRLDEIVEEDRKDRRGGPY